MSCWDTLWFLVKIIKLLSLYRGWTYTKYFHYTTPRKKEKLVCFFSVVFRGSHAAYLSNVTPDFGIVIVDINLKVSPNNECIVMEVISACVLLKLESPSRSQNKAGSVAPFAARIIHTRRFLQWTISRPCYKHRLQNVLGESTATV